MEASELIARAIRLENTPRIPTALLSGGVWTFNRKGYSLQDLLPQPETAADLIAATNEEVGSDIVWPGSGYHNLAIRALGGAIKFRAQGAPDVQAPLLESTADIRRIDLQRLRNDAALQSLWRVAERVVQKVGAKTLVGSSQWGPFTLAGHFYGVEKLMRSIYKDQAAVHAVLEFTTEVCLRYLEPFIEAGIGIVSVADPSASGDLISREQFRNFGLPYLKRVFTGLHQRGALVSLHICGNITNRLDLIPETGADILSLDYKVDLGRVKEVLGGKIAFAGNMNPVGIMQNASSAEVAAACRQCIEKAGPVPGYILMPGCDIPPGVPLANIQAMVRTAREFRPQFVEVQKNESSGSQGAPEARRPA